MLRMPFRLCAVRERSACEAFEAILHQLRRAGDRCWRALSRQATTPKVPRLMWETKPGRPSASWTSGRQHDGRHRNREGSKSARSTGEKCLLKFSARLKVPNLASFWNKPSTSHHVISNNRTTHHTAHTAHTAHT